MDKIFTKKSTPKAAKQTGLFGKPVKEAKEDEDMQVTSAKPSRPKYVPWVEK